MKRLRFAVRSTLLTLTALSGLACGGGKDDDMRTPEADDDQSNVPDIVVEGGTGGTVSNPGGTPGGGTPDAGLIDPMTPEGENVGTLIGGDGPTLETPDGLFGVQFYNDKLRTGQEVWVQEVDVEIKNLPDYVTVVATYQVGPFEAVDGNYTEAFYRADLGVEPEQPFELKPLGMGSVDAEGNFVPCDWIDMEYLNAKAVECSPQTTGIVAIVESSLVTFTGSAVPATHPADGSEFYAEATLTPTDTLLGMDVADIVVGVSGGYRLDEGDSQGYQSIPQTTDPIVSYTNLSCTQDGAARFYYWVRGDSIFGETQSALDWWEAEIAVDVDCQ